MEESAMRALLAAARVGRLATVTRSGAPRVLACCFAVAGDRCFTAIDDKPKRSLRPARLDDIASHPRVALLADHYEEDWGRLWWVRADGEAHELGAGEENEMERGLDLLAAKYPQYRESRPPGPVVAIDVLRWSGWAAAEKSGKT